MKALEKIEIKQNLKISKLLEGSVKHDPKNIIHNYSSHSLTDDQESLLLKGLNFALPPKTLKYEDYMLPYELCFRDISKADIIQEDLLFAKSDLRNIAYTSFKSYNKNNHKFDNISKGEYKAFLELIELVDNGKNNYPKSR